MKNQDHKLVFPEYMAGNYLIVPCEVLLLDKPYPETIDIK